MLARYGRSFRGVNVREAEERGAIGVLLYSDPAEDGYAAGDTLPAGPFRPAGAVQRGTVEYLWRYTGDPLTPGRPALPGVARLDPAEATNLPRIPVAPLPYGEAVRILGALEGPAPPAGFRGALPAAEDVADPLTGRPLAGAWRARQQRAGATGASHEPAKPVLADLGAGSDWTAFFHFAGVPSLQWTMNGRGTYGVYHSALDDFRYYHYADRIGAYIDALARTRLESGGTAVPAQMLDGLRARVRELHRAAAALERRQADVLAAGDTTALRRMDVRLPAVERAFLDAVDTLESSERQPPEGNP